ncbi:MAG: M23 family metallopeptidase [Candidatus Dependentiae bacterium]|nr:M23 family metallopeptidase [Candidatus Dependentiae bacterium]
MCIVLCMQYISFVAEVKKMNLVKDEYHNYLEMLKKIIQEKNCDVVTDDLDTFEDKSEDDKNVEVQIPLEVSSDLVVSNADEEDILDEQDEDTQKFQFISAEDEKQLKDLRKQTREVVRARKKAKKKPQKNLGERQIAQLQKNSSHQIVQDFTFHWPLELHHFWLSSLFGARKKANGKPGFHYGIDLAAMKGTPVKAAAAGTVIQAQYVPGYGNNVLIQHNKYYRTRYAHLNRIHATVGQKVEQGQKIGTVGDTGSVRKTGRDASHLHFEIYHNGSHVNPLRYLFN